MYYYHFRYATSQSKPAPDTSQDISGIHLHYHNNKVGVALFSRKMDTGDGKDYRLSNDAYLLFARGPMTTSTSVPDISKHSFKAVSEQKISFSSCGRLNIGNFLIKGLHRPGPEVIKLFSSSA